MAQWGVKRWSSITALHRSQIPLKTSILEWKTKFYRMDRNLVDGVENMCVCVFIRLAYFLGEDLFENRFKNCISYLWLCINFFELTGLKCLLYDRSCRLGVQTWLSWLLWLWVCHGGAPLTSCLGWISFLACLIP